MNGWKTAWLLPLLSVGVQMPPDSTETRIGFSGGGGNYSLISRDCSGNAIGATEVPFAVFTGSVEQQLTDEIWIGARVEGFKRKKTRRYDQISVYDTQDESYDYIVVDRSTGTLFTPFVGIESKHIGLAAGIIHPLDKFTLGDLSFESTQPCGKLRLGRLDRYHIEGSYGFNTPVVAGGGMIDLGLGIPLEGIGGRLWVGVDALPYEASGVLLKLNARLADGLYLTGSGRLASAGGITTERAMSLGFSYRWKH